MYAFGLNLAVGGLTCGAGFIAATVLLHAVGLAGGLLLGRGGAGRGATWVRGRGGVASLAGVAIMTGVL